MERGRCGALASWAVVVSTLVVAQTVRAEPGTATLFVQRGVGAEGCEDTHALRERINRIAERDAIVRGDASLRLTLQFDRAEAGPGFRALLHVSSQEVDAPSGNREFSDVGPTCLALDEAIAVSIALLLDDVPRAAPVISPDATTHAPPKPLSPVEYSERPTASATFDASAITSAGVVGSSTFGFELGFDFRATRPAPGKRIAPYLTVGVGLLTLIEDVEPTAGGEIHLHLVAARVPACFAFHVANQSFGAQFCGFPALGTMIATGRGYAENATAYEPWFSLGASAIAEAAIVGPLSFTGRLELLVPIARPTFVLERLGTGGATQDAFEPSPVGAAAGVGIRALIP
ncbi:MAG: hypothetical protein U0414_14850 [Polyangiaceae bacterium]